MQLQSQQSVGNFDLLGKGVSIGFFYPLAFIYPIVLEEGCCAFLCVNIKVLTQQERR